MTSPFPIGNTSSVRVHFTASYVRLPECIHFDHRRSFNLKLSISKLQKSCKNLPKNRQHSLPGADPQHPPSHADAPIPAHVPARLRKRPSPRPMVECKQLEVNGKIKQRRYSTSISAWIPEWNLSEKHWKNTTDQDSWRLLHSCGHLLPLLFLPRWPRSSISTRPSPELPGLNASVGDANSSLTGQNLSVNQPGFALSSLETTLKNWRNPGNL